MLMRVVEPRHPRDDGDHLGKDTAGLKSGAGYAVALAAGLLFWAGQGTQAQGGGELSLRRSFSPPTGRRFGSNGCRSCRSCRRRE